MKFSLGTQERSRISRGKGAVGVRATEVLLYVIDDTELKHISPNFTVIRNTCFLIYNVLKTLFPNNALKNCAYFIKVYVQHFKAMV